MRVFRIEREKYLESTLSGLGAAQTDGFRWNSLNTRLVYTCESRALATLEVSVHLDLSEDLPRDRYYVEIDIPDEVEFLELGTGDLPESWASKPPSRQTQYIGDDFVNENSAAVLKVPSYIVPFEYNYLINPSHPQAKLLSVVSMVPLSFDSRFAQTKNP